jgi:predicted ribonuclease YlaK
MPKSRGKSSGIGSTNPVPFGMSNRQMKRKKPINLDYARKIEPLTDNQEIFFDAYKKNQNMVAYGCAGTGKTVITLYNALQDVLNVNTQYEKIYIVRSLVPTREIGFLPGDHEDKSDIYQIPYKNMVKYMFEMPDDSSFDMLYNNLKAQGTISFWSTSYIRGTTFDNSILIVDEFQNLNFHELDSIITRVGEGSKIMFCGDATQSDLVKMGERNGIIDFMRILKNMPSFDVIEFQAEDICRSGFVKEYITTKLELGL